MGVSDCSVSGFVVDGEGVRCQAWCVGVMWACCAFVWVLWRHRRFVAWGRCAAAENCVGGSCGGVDYMAFAVAYFAGPSVDVADVLTGFIVLA